MCSRAHFDHECVRTSIKCASKDHAIRRHGSTGFRMVSVEMGDRIGRAHSSTCRSRSRENALTRGN